MDVEYSGNIPVIRLPERVDLTNSHLLKETLFFLYDKGYYAIQLDFSRLQSLDSTGLGQLIIFQKKLKEQGGNLQIKNVVFKNIMDLFYSIDLHKVMDITE